MKKSIVVYEKGYARVSNLDQNLDMQQVAQKEAGCEKIYREEVSGVGERTELQSAYGISLTATAWSCTSSTGLAVQCGNS